MRDRGKNGFDRSEDVPILVAAGFESTRNGGGTQRIAVTAHYEALRVGIVQVAEQGVRRCLGRIPRPQRWGGCAAFGDLSPMLGMHGGGNRAYAPQHG